MSVREAVLRAHAGQIDKQGAPYEHHLLRVEAAVSVRARHVALLHDAIEDRRMTGAQVGSLVEPDEFAAVWLLTRTGETYAEYIGAIRDADGAPGELAREVKVADLRDNLARMTPELEDLFPKLRSRYERALAVLSAA